MRRHAAVRALLLNAIGIFQPHHVGQLIIDLDNPATLIALRRHNAAACYRILYSLESLPRQIKGFAMSCICT